ncbi:hypothetical protein DYI25_11600 [Mesobacillus boroniphilus]|uniref:Uncharacterized protein n=1 Tax=Mesobacillus boroniphilus TaxID=308892 RepID=A0A944GWL5_9BACI|nr:hypothetical protein [Mesobacillus boroniphilus]MBS8265088.1 hypothetical protein [Mesobacillus boroniphilus]
MLKNDRGYALVLVLVIITITFTFALSMSSMALSARKQFNKTDEINKATDIAEMGVGHYETLLYKLVKVSNQEVSHYSTSLFDSQFYQNIKSKVLNSNNLPASRVEGNNKYVITDATIARPTNDKIIVSFKSTGKTDKETKVLTNKITVEKKKPSRAGEPAPPISSFNHKFWQSYEMAGGKEIDEYQGSSYFTQSVELKGNTQLIIHGDAFFNSSVVLKGGDKLIVYGDAIFNVPLDDKSINGSNSSICVYGFTYYVDKLGKLAVYNPFPGGDPTACPKPLNIEWFIDPVNGIEVQY